MNTNNYKASANQMESGKCILESILKCQELRNFMDGSQDTPALVHSDRITPAIDVYMTPSGMGEDFDSADVSDFVLDKYLLSPKLQLGGDMFSRNTLLSTKGVSELDASNADNRGNTRFYHSGNDLEKNKIPRLFLPAAVNRPKSATNGCNEPTATFDKKNQSTSGKNKREFETCPTCKKSFLKKNINEHVKTHSSSRKKKECDYEGCNKEYLHVRDLVRHVNFMHKGVKFPCHSCSKAFDRPNKLRKHRNQHHFDT